MGGAEMKNNEIHEKIQSDFLKNVSDILLQARKNAKTAVYGLRLLRNRQNDRGGRTAR